MTWSRVINLECSQEPGSRRACFHGHKRSRTLDVGASVHARARSWRCRTSGALAPTLFPANLVESFHQVQVGQGSVEAVDERLAIGRDQNRTNGGDAGWVSRHKLLPQSSFSGGVGE